MVGNAAAVVWCIAETDGWVSPRLDIRFDTTTGPELIVFGSDGRPFLDTSERRRHMLEQLHAVEAARRELTDQRRRNELMADKLRELGIDPDVLALRLPDMPT